MAAWLRNSADKARAALATAGENVGRRVGLEDYDSLFHNDPETGYAVRSVALLREDTKSLQAALEKYKRAVETSVQGGVLELGLKGFSQALIEIASRDSIKARNMAVLELRENDPMADVKEAAIALGNVYRRAGDARLRLAARMQMYLSALISEMEATYVSDVKPLKKAYGASRCEAREKARAGGTPEALPEAWRPLSAQLRHAAAAFVATFAPRVVAALHEFAAHEAASFSEVASELLPAATHTAPNSPSASRFSRGSAVPPGAALADALLSAERGLAATHIGVTSPCVADSGSPAAPGPRTPPSEGDPAEEEEGSSGGSARGVLARHSSGDSDASETSPELQLPGSASKA